MTANMTATETVANINVAPAMHLDLALQSALKAHGAWKQRMVRAVAHKNVNISLEELRQSEISTFGQFLMGLPAEMQNSPRVTEVRRLHADLHMAAVEAMLLVKQGKHDEARAALSTGAFPQISAALNQALVRWQVRDLAA
jgi:radical SAM superfamily enzyme